MARFRGTIKGQRGEASRLGTLKSGLLVRANGWDIGGEVEMLVSQGQDVVNIAITDGSNGGRGARTIANAILSPDQKTVTVTLFGKDHEQVHQFTLDRW
jgi:hypothetical protein